MKLKEIIEFLDEKIPEKLALDFDNVGLMGDWDLNLDISSVKILMDLWPEDDSYGKDTLLITHHPPLFNP
ncbi:Nif3-like dinuclear metal center hexameric protein, partial [Methanobrevibacter sp.]